ncbi:uncharacterized protein LOC134245053 isoform X1 [Saccostrea cucullata]|uniref:uncharacterized protein LOC134245053 isoform X1 n=1 Tax=Saccostrea cuccullata TaxID=36930 RepID=UPI002ED65C38
MFSFPPLLCRKKYQIWNDEINKIQVNKSAKEEVLEDRVACADIYDVDNEHNYIMTKALKSYRLHREKEKAESRQQQLRSAYRRRWHAPVVPSKLRKSSASQVRPKTANDVIRQVQVANTEERVYRKPTPIELSRITISMGESPKQINYQRRNKTTWMSHSFPSASFLNHYAKLHQLSQSRVENLPPAGKPTKTNRPQSAYAYDGGMFTPTGPKNEIYVIDPEWVSEAMTIQKLNLNRRPNTLVTSASDTWPGRRCKSAPPQNRRNPISWDIANEPEHV